MRRRERHRRAAKWTGVGACGLIGALALCSAHWGICYGWASGGQRVNQVGIAHGMIFVHSVEGPMRRTSVQPRFGTGWSCGSNESPGLLRFGWRAQVAWGARVRTTLWPLWHPFGVVATLTA